MYDIPARVRLVMKVPKQQVDLLITTGQEAKAVRLALGLTQEEFWGRVKVNQPGGCRHESGRDMPRSVRLLLQLAYGSEVDAQNLFFTLRGK